MKPDTRDVFHFAGIPIDNIPLDDSIALIEGLIRDNKKGFVVTPNAAHITLVQTDTEFKRVYDKAFLRLPDSMPLVWVSAALGSRLKDRITGTDLLLQLCSVSARKGYRVFLLGAEENIVQKVSEVLLERYEGLNIVGTHNGYFSDDASVVSYISNRHPDIVFLALGYARQEKWIAANIDMLDIHCAVCIGGVFDVVAGKVRRAPVLLQKMGLEWFWRLLNEPGRLWRRYLYSNGAFIILFIKEFITSARRTKRGLRDG